MLAPVFTDFAHPAPGGLALLQDLKSKRSVNLRDQIAELITVGNSVSGGHMEGCAVLRLFLRYL